MPQTANASAKPLLHLLVVNSTEPLRTACGIGVHLHTSDPRVVLQTKFVECEACLASVDFESALAMGMETVLLGTESVLGRSASTAGTLAGLAGTKIIGAEEKK